MSRWICCISVALLAFAGSASASGGDPEDEFVSRTATDLDLDRYANGELGVVLVTYPRVYLYPAWRATVLGADGLRTHPVRAGGMQEAVGTQLGGWVGRQAWNDWLHASEAYVQRPAGKPAYRSVMRGGLGEYLNCPDEAFRFAAANLEALALRPDAQPDRLREWAQAQDAVFELCDYDPKQPRVGRPEAAIPALLGRDAPLFWRQWREYQVASANFYDEKWESSQEAFARIGATPGHPLRQWGAYLALRSKLRLTTRLGDGDQDGKKAALADMQDDANRILADASLQPMHEMTRATMRAARFRLAPTPAHMREMSALLADTAADPTRESALGDWRRLLNDQLDTQAAAPIDADLRGRYAYFDWIRTVQQCGQAAFEQRNTECAAAYAHAQERWGVTRGDERKAWQLAALMVADTLSPALENAALQVTPAAPEYLTVRYHLARLYRLYGETQRTREIAGSVLASAELARTRSASARVLFAQERFATAISLEDAVPWLERPAPRQVDRDTAENSPSRRENDPPRIAADGQAWINTRLAVGDLLALARDTRLHAVVRTQVAVAAWWRADLLGQANNARAAAQLAGAQPLLKTVANAYLAAPDASAKRHVLILAGLRQGLAPEIGAWPNLQPPTLQTTPDPAKDQPVAGMWCHLGRASDSTVDDRWGNVEQVPSPPDLSRDAAQRDRELAALAKVRTATGFVGAYALARARMHPKDPEVPWLLHVVVMSTRGGCVDADNHALSRKAWQELQRRYPESAWALKTPYFY